MSFRTFIYVVFTIGFFLTKLQGQHSLPEQNYYFEHITVKDGISQSSVLSIHQDRLGFIWLGTRDGLNRYDGHNFKVFRNKIGDTSSILGNIIYDIKEDIDGNIWLATENGISKYNALTETFDNYSVPFHLSKKSKVDVIFINAKNDLWIGGNFGILRLDLSKKKFSKDILASNDKFENRSYSVNTIIENRNGNLLIGTSRSGILEWNPVTKKLRPFYNGKNHDIDLTRTESIVLHQNDIWVGTYGNGLYQFDVDGNFLNHYHKRAESNAYKLSDDHIRVLQSDAENLWVGTFKGINLLDDDLGINIITYKEGDSKGLSHSSIRAFHKDKKGSIWIGTYFGGVSIYDKNNQRFDHFYNVSGDTTSLSYNVIGALEGNENDKLFIGTERGGLNIYDANDKKHIKPDNPLLSNSTIKSLHIDGNKTLWAGVFREGLHYFDPQSKKLVQHVETQAAYSPLNKVIINCMAKAKPNAFWVGTDDKGLQLFNFITKQYQDFGFSEVLNEIIKNHPIKSIYTKDDSICLATQGAGLVHFNPNTGATTVLKDFKIDGGELTVTEFNHVTMDKENIIWLSTNGKGLISYNPKSQKSTYLGFGKGLNSNMVLGTMLEKNSNSIWAVTRKGLFKINKTTNSVIKSYSYSSGFPLQEINEGAFYISDSGYFFVGGNNGYVRFNPKGIQDNTYSPKPVITYLKLFNKELRPNDKNKVLTQELSKTKEITLDYFQSVLSIEFASLNYLRPENNQYAYMLEGFDDYWVNSGTRREVTYTNLPDGTYTFLVKSANNDGIWNNVPARLEITVLPPPWATWWAYCIYAFVLGLTFYLIRYNAIKSTQLQNNLKIEQLEKQKWKEIHDLKLQYFIDVSHEFKTPLTLLLAPLEEIIGAVNKNKWLHSRVKIMHLNAKRLQLLINQILEIREIETGHSQLNTEPLYIKTLLKDIVDSFHVIAEANKIKLSLTYTGNDDIPVIADRDKLEKIFFNLLSNAFKFTKKDGEVMVIVKFKRQANQIKYSFKVSDTGIGIDSKNLEHIFVRFYKERKKSFGAGIGLSLTKSLVELMDGTIGVESTQGKGTTFFMDIPFAITDFNLDEHYENYKAPIPMENQDIRLVPLQSDSTDTKKETLLLVEDSKELRNYLKESLSSEYNIITANNGLLGLKKAKTSAPDIIVSDIMMPEMDGLELCKQLKTTKELCHIPIILLTAKNAQVHKLEGLELGADDYIPKPFNLSELKTRIKNIVNNRNLIRQKFLESGMSHKMDEIKLNSYDEKLINTIIDITKAQFDKPNFNVDYLSKEVNLSRVHLTRKLKSILGMTPAEYIKDFRMKHAIKMLEHGGFKVADIAYAVGYQDVRHFSKVFKATFGKSPMNYSFKNEDHLTE